MSDYLSALAARVIGGPGSMHPRTASRFEPAESWDRGPAKLSAGFQPAIPGESMPAGSIPSDRHDAGPTLGAVPAEATVQQSAVNRERAAGRVAEEAQRKPTTDTNDVEMVQAAASGDVTPRVIGGPGSMHPRTASRFEPAESWDRGPAELSAGFQPPAETGPTAGFQPAIPGESVPAGSLLSDRHDAGPTLGAVQAEATVQQSAVNRERAAGRVAEEARRKPATGTNDVEMVQAAASGDVTPSPDPPPTRSEAPPPTRPLPRSRAIVREQGLANAIERLPARRKSAAPGREAAAPAPIEITIGRIDIRAVVATPPQRPKAKPGPRLTTLEEYAAKRSGGGR